MSALAHLSDLHLGRSVEILRTAERIVRELVETDVDHVVVTGDVTHRGLTSEWELFQKVFSPLAKAGRLTVVPGNHDRLNEDPARQFCSNERVSVFASEGLHIVRLDSTGPHNRSVFRGHGQLTAADLFDLDAAIDSARSDAFVVVLLHHHPLPLPEESISEHLSSWVGLPFAHELDTGRMLIETCTGRVDAILHGHRHEPVTRAFYHPTRSLSLFNAGATTELGAYRVLQHSRGRLLTTPAWRTPGRWRGAHRVAA